MKLGEIKIGALMLIHPSAAMEYDNEDMQEVIDLVKQDFNYSSYLTATVGAINRAFSSIEYKGLSREKSALIDLSHCKLENEGLIIDISHMDDVLALKRVIFRGEELDFNFEAPKRVRIRNVGGKGELTLVYRSKIKRISHASNENEEVDLDEHIAQLIPYFVKGDLLLGQDASEAIGSRELFEKMTDELSTKNENQGENRKSVYCLFRM